MVVGLGTAGFFPVTEAFIGARWPLTDLWFSTQFFPSEMTAIRFKAIRFKI
jgi:hypothetical protein